MRPVYAWRVTVVGVDSDGGSIINAHTSGQARARVWRDIRGLWEMDFTQLRTRKLGAPVSSPDFLRTVGLRGLPDLRCGDIVTYQGVTGTVIGADPAMNLNILDDHGRVHHVHPGDLQS